MMPCVPPGKNPAALGRDDATPLVIGLIGGIGGGKSQVSGMLASRGAVVIVADAVGHELLNDPEVRDQIVRRFGAEVMTGPALVADSSPRIDRRALGAIVFADPAARRDLEAILHPEMRTRFTRTIQRAADSDQSIRPMVVLDAAILLEAGWDDLCDLIVFVDAPRAERVRRVAAERGWSEQILDSRENAQWPIDEKRRRADFVVVNDDGLDHLRREVDRLIDFVEDRTRPGAVLSELKVSGTAVGTREEMPVGSRPAPPRM